MTYYWKDKDRNRQFNIHAASLWKTEKKSFVEQCAGLWEDLNYVECQLRKWVRNYYLPFKYPVWYFFLSKFSRISVLNKEDFLMSS